ncbi:MAG: anti-sigma-I factor RsgI family protein [Bacillota bacterium]
MEFNRRGGMIIMLVGWYFYRAAMPVAVAHVSLDINPSLELSVDQNSCVIDGIGYNDEGKLLLVSVPVIGKNVYTAIADLIAVAIQQHYLDPNKENVVFTTIVQADPAVAVSARPVVEEELVFQAIVSSVETVNIPVEVLITKAEPKLQQQAKQTGVSTGRFLLYQDALKDEPNLKDTDLKTRSLRDLKIKQWSDKYRSQIKGNRNINLKNGSSKNKNEFDKDKTGANNGAGKKRSNEPNKEKDIKSNPGQAKTANEKNKKDDRDRDNRDKNKKDKNDRDKHDRDKGDRDKDDKIKGDRDKDDRDKKKKDNNDTK